ncbi:hypothetical protein BCD48_44330 [Pseudofrankia sp. BMG5.36]|nr:hypothetical protein BCD48_44330 [Pseudofrankia sp. BMG5.36]
MLRVERVGVRGGVVVFVCEGGPTGRVRVGESWTDRGGDPLSHRLAGEALVELKVLVDALARRREQGARVGG